MLDYFERSRIKDIVDMEIEDPGDVLVMGWVKTLRETKNIAFLEINDGSTVKNLQIIILSPDEFPIEKLNTGASVRVKGYVEEVEGREQSVEMKAEELKIVGEAPEDYPLQKKEHTYEFLREIAHLRPRTNTFGVVNRFRSRMSMAVHKFFQERGFHYIHSPIITTSDAEGAGEMFRISTLDLDDLPRTEDGDVDFSEDFFGQKAGLTVSGQLEAELLACALGDVYTFGPTFRAENSNTSRHASEFWMIEPEMAFCELDEMLVLIEKFIKYLFDFALNETEEEMDFFAEWVKEDRREMLMNIKEANFGHITYTEAVDILESSDEDFEYPVEWGVDLKTEHERYLTENYFEKPLMVTDYPAEIKPFYMKVNAGEERNTVRAVDCLVPEVGEIIGGSQREERYDVLKQRMKAENLDMENYHGFMEIRKYGTVPHSGFGLGFERLLMYISGMENIRDIIPFPRTPGTAR